MEDAEVSLSFDDVVNILGYLTPEELVRVSAVSKLWRDASDVSSLWKRHCLQRWAFCNLNKVEPGSRTWQRYFQARYKIDTGTATGRPGVDYVCKTLRGHGDKVADLIYVSSNKIYDEGIINKQTHPVIASGSRDKGVYLWDPTNGKVMWKGVGQHEAAISHLKLISPGELFASGDAEGNLNFWDVATGNNTKIVDTLNSEVVAMETGSGFTSKGFECKDQKILYAASRNGEIKLWDIRDSTKAVSTLDCPMHNLDSMTVLGHHLIVTSKGSLFNLGSNDVKVYDVRNLMRDSYRHPELFTLHKEDSSVCASTVLSQQNTLAVGYSDGSITLWDVTKGQEIHTFNAHVGKVSTMSAVGTQLFSAGDDLRVCLWDVINKKLQTSFSNHQAEITSIYADASKVMTCSRDYSIRVYSWVKPLHGGSSHRELKSCYTLLGGSLQRAGNGFEKVISDYTTCIGMANDVMKAYSFQV